MWHTMVLGAALKMLKTNEANNALNRCLQFSISVFHNTGRSNFRGGDAKAGTEKVVWTFREKRHDPTEHCTHIEGPDGFGIRAVDGRGLGGDVQRR